MVEIFSADGNSINNITDVLSPVIAWDDDFGKDMQIESIDNSNWKYDIVNIDAYTLNNISINRETRYDCYIHFNASDQKLSLNHFYTAEYRRTIFFVRIGSLNAAFRIGLEIYELSAEGSMSRDIDFAGLIAGKPKNIDVQVGSIFMVEIIHEPFDSSIVITDINNQTNKQTVMNCGESKGHPFISWLSGSFDLLGMRVILYGANPDYYITGDSILMNKSVSTENKWANKFKKLVPNTVVSGRGTSNYTEVLKRMFSEIQYLKPHTVIDQNSANGTREDFALFITNWCKENRIEYIHTMSTLSNNFPNGGRDWFFIRNGIRVIRFDKATAIEHNLSKGIDENLFGKDGLHPNDAGSLKMFEQLIYELGLS